MNDKFKNIQDNLNEIISEINKEKEYNDNIETNSLKKLKKINKKINTYDSSEWQRSYVIKNLKETLNSLFYIVQSQNKRITKLEKQIETIHERKNDI